MTRLAVYASLAMYGLFIALAFLFELACYPEQASKAILMAVLFAINTICVGATAYYDAKATAEYFAIPNAPTAGK
jgi:tetrahydromethanopterin S-methyltransferase subunit C